jgi:hypothetical protein
MKKISSLIAIIGIVVLSSSVIGH